MKKLIGQILIILLLGACTQGANHEPYLQEQTALVSPLDKPSTIRVVFPSNQLEAHLDNLRLEGEGSIKFLIDATLGDRFVFHLITDEKVQIAQAVLNPNGEMLMAGHGRSLDWSSSRTTNGDFLVRLHNESDTVVNYGIRINRTLPTVDQLSLDDLLAKFREAGVPATHAPSVQRETEFDALYGYDVSTREILYLSERTHRVHVYIFENSAAAGEATTLVEPGSNLLTRRNMPTQKQSVLSSPLKVLRETFRGNDRVKLYADTGTIPLWWQEGRFLVYSASPDPAVAEQVMRALGMPLGQLPVDAVNIRLSNQSDASWQNIVLASGNTQIVYGELYPGVGGYQSLPPGKPIEITAEFANQPYKTQLEPLAAGDYNIYLTLHNDRLLARAFNDGDYHVAEDLVNVTWLWRRLEHADGNISMPFTSPTFTPSLRFNTETTSNFGEAGLLYGGNLGCNGMGGRYFVNERNELLLRPGFGTLMLCEDEKMASESLGTGHLLDVYRYEIEGDELHLSTLEGNRFIFDRETEISAESKIYADIINGWDGGNTPFLVVVEPAFNRKGVSERETRQQVIELFPDRGYENLTVSVELLDIFFAHQRDNSALELDFPNGSSFLIRQTELDTLFANGSKAGWQALEERYPGTQTIFTFSRVGFAGERALVYYSIRTRSAHSGYYSLRFHHNGMWVGNTTNLIW